MAIRQGVLGALLFVVIGIQPVLGQVTFRAPTWSTSPAAGAKPASTGLANTAPAAPAALTPAAPSETHAGLRITKGSGTLPNEHGQVWREYDISPYTSRVKDNDKPQQAVIDWILRETGTDVWFAEPLGVLSATTTTLRVYHTPQMQQTVRDLVERFVNTGDESHALGIRLVTVGSPNWRSRAVPLLKPIDVKSAGVEGWVLSRENAAMLFEELKARSDFREHSAPHVEIYNGQSQTLARTQPQRYSRGVQQRTDGLGYELIPGQIETGYSLNISPLLALDGKSVDVAIKCQVDQLEKLVPIVLDVPVVGQGPRVQIQVPQLVSWRLSERIRWPSDQVLLLSCGVVANPATDAGSVMAAMNPFGASKSRADALLLVEYRGVAGQTPTEPPAIALPPAAVQPPTTVPAARAAVSPRRY